jgi:hypothetical protein
MNNKIILIASLLVFAAGCGSSSASTADKHTSDYIGLQLAWEAQTLEDQVVVCFNIEEDPSIVASSAIDNNIDPDISEAFFDEVCP